MEDVNLDPRIKHANKYEVPSVSRALKALEHFIESDRDRFTLSELCRDLDIPMGSLYKILATLESNGFLTKLEDSSYVVGPGLARLALRYMRKFDLPRVAAPAMRILADQAQETVECGILDTRHWGLLVVEKVNSPQPIQLVSDAGVFLHPHTMAGGKVLLAHQSEPVVERFLREHGLPGYTPRTITSPERFRECLHEVRRQGYAVDYQDARVDVCRAAAPVRDAFGAAVAFIGIAGPTFRLTPDDLQELVPLVIQAAERVSAETDTCKQRPPST